VPAADALVRDAERRLTEASERLARLEGELARLEAAVASLEADLSQPVPMVASSRWRSLLPGLAVPLAALAAALLFAGGVWPLGLLAGVVTVVQLLLLPWLNRSPS